MLYRVESHALYNGEPCSIQWRAMLYTMESHALYNGEPCSFVLGLCCISGYGFVFWGVVTHPPGPNTLAPTPNKPNRIESNRTEQNLIDSNRMLPEIDRWRAMLYTVESHGASGVRLRKGVNETPELRCFIRSGALRSIGTHDN